MNELLFLKLGGSILTDKNRPESLDEVLLAELAAVIAAALRTTPERRFLIGHGGGSFGHYWAQRYATQQGAYDAHGWEGVARVADAMGRLNRDVVRHLLAAGINAMGVQPSASALASAGELRGMATESLAAFLAAGIIPVVHGDVAIDLAQGATIISTEMVFAFLAPVLQPRSIVLVGESAVYTADPRHDPSAVRIPTIDETNIEDVLQHTGGSHGVDVTGGMASKVATMWGLASIINGLSIYLVGADPIALDALLNGDESAAGTVIRRTKY